MRTLAVATILAGLSASAAAQIRVTSVLETYFLASQEAKGFAHNLSWGEHHIRFDDRWRGTFSYTLMPTRRMYDEFCLNYEQGPSMVRIGRLRTAFGFSDWSELFYNGFNHRPVVRNLSLVDSLRLLRNDWGVEVTHSGAAVQIQAALIDPEITAYELAPTRLRAGTLRLQSQVGPLIAGVDALKYWNDDRRVLGFDLRWSTPRILARAEYFAGSGGQRNSAGYYADVAWRLPKLARTQLVGRAEGMDTPQSAFQHYTLGARQLVNRELSLNLNYGWSTGDRPANLGNRAPENWTLQAMYRVSF